MFNRQNISQSIMMPFCITNQFLFVILPQIYTIYVNSIQLIITIREKNTL